MRLAILFVCALALSMTSCDAIRSGNRNQGSEREIGIVNVSGSNVEIYWTNPLNKQLHLTSPAPFLEHGDAFELGSYVGHSFMVKELPSKLGNCINGDDPDDPKKCGRAYFKVSDGANKNTFQAFHIAERLEILIKDTTTIESFHTEDIASGTLTDCEAIALQTIQSTKDHDPSSMIKAMTKCVEEAVADKMIRASEEIKFQAQLRGDLAEKLENYTCADYDLPSSTPVRTEEWHHHASDHARKVDVLHDRSSSKIHVVQNFISEEECAAMEKAAFHKLHHATVADGKGGSELSPHRKAMQAGIRIPWSEEEDGNLLTKISRRVYDYNNHVLNLNIDEHGQEDLMSIQYKGRGIKDKEPDRYMPHCDGECTGAPHRPGQRMATVVMYCTVPEVGGATNFRKSGLHVVPEVGSASYFAYTDPDSFVMDDHWTEHSGCPVIEGEKKIVTQWIRYGVDEKNPWDSFNTLGIKYSDLKDDE